MYNEFRVFLMKGFISMRLILVVLKLYGGVEKMVGLMLFRRIKNSRR